METAESPSNNGFAVFLIFWDDAFFAQITEGQVGCGIQAVPHSDFIMGKNSHAVVLVRVAGTNASDGITGRAILSVARKNFRVKSALILVPQL